MFYCSILYFGHILCIWTFSADIKYSVHTLYFIMLKFELNKA